MARDGMKACGRDAAVLLGMLLACGMAIADGGGATAPRLPFTVTKETTVLTSPLRKDGAVDYVAALNEKYGKGVTPQNNGFVVWLEVVGTGDNVLVAKSQPKVLQLLGIQAEAVQGAGQAGKFMTYTSYLKHIERLDDPAIGAASNRMDQSWQRPWKAEDDPHLAAYLTYEKKNLDLAREAAARPKWWSPYVGDSMIAVLLPSLGLLREATNALDARATLRFQAGDFTGFLADVTAARQLARHLASGATLIERLVGVAMEARACETLGAIAGSGALTAEQCAQLTRAMRDFGALPPMAEAVDQGERWIQLDCVRMVALDEKLPSLEGDAADTFRDLDRQAVDWNLVLKRVNQEMDVEVASFKAPTMEGLHKAGAAEGDRLTGWQQAAQGSTLQKNPDETREAYSNRVAETFMAVMMPSLGKSEELYRRVSMQEGMVHTVIAAAEIHAKSGKWPVKLEDLPLAALKEVPLDAYSKDGAQPVHYLVTDKGLRIYSVGPNGEDDGGVRDTQANLDDIMVGVRDD